MTGRQDRVLAVGANGLDGDEVVQQEKEHLDVQRERSDEDAESKRHAHRRHDRLGRDGVLDHDEQVGDRIDMIDRTGAGPRPERLGDRERACIAIRRARRRGEDSPKIFTVSFPRRLEHGSWHTGNESAYERRKRIEWGEFTTRVRRPIDVPVLVRVDHDELDGARASLIPPMNFSHTREPGRRAGSNRCRDEGERLGHTQMAQGKNEDDCAGTWAPAPLSSRTRAEQRSRHAQQTISPGGVCTQCARRINQDAHHRFKIPLWNLRREQQISRYVSAWYPYSQYPQTAGRSPGPPRISPIPRAGPLALPTVSSHGEFTAA